MMTFFAVLLIAHGAAHLPGFIVPWKLAYFSEMPYKTSVLGGTLDLGADGVKLLGLLWLVAGSAFFLDGFAIWLKFPYWRQTAYVAAVLSLNLSILGWPDSRVGVVVNLAVLLLLYQFFKT